MLHRSMRLVGLACAFTALASTAFAQLPQVGGYKDAAGQPQLGIGAGVFGLDSGTGKVCAIGSTSTCQLPIAGTISASLTGFHQTSTGTPITATTSGVTGTLPSGAVVIATNTDTTNSVYCTPGASTSTSGQAISPNNGWFAFTITSETQITCLSSASTVKVNLVGGTGLPTGTGGGGGGGVGNVNLTGINGVTPLVGAGATGTGSARVTAAQDTTTIAGSAPGTVGSSSSYAVPVQGVAGGVGVGVTGNQSNAGTGVTGSANVPVVSYNYVWNGSSWIQWIGAVTAVSGSHVDGWDATQGTTTAAASCSSGATIAACQKQTDTDIKGSVPAGSFTIGATGYDPSVVPVTSASINVSTATTTQVVALSSGKLIYVSGGVVMAGGTGNITFEYGTGTACATGTTVLGGAMPLVANVGFIIPDKTYVVPSGNALCVLTSAAVQYSGTVGYVQK